MKIKIALTKGRLLPNQIKLLQLVGMDCTTITKEDRRLIFDIPHDNVQVVLLKAYDVPTYVEHGIVDMGIVGKDILLEEKKQLYEVIDLRFGKCILAIAGYHGGLNEKKHLRVATKYPNIAREHFSKKGQSVEIIKQEGSVELAPLLGLSDVILDIVETGSTLKANGLTVLDEVIEVSARLVVNKVSYATKGAYLKELINQITPVINRWEEF